MTLATRSAASLTAPDPESATRAKELLTPFRDLMTGQVRLSQQSADYLEILIGEAIHAAMRGPHIYERQKWIRRAQNEAE